MSHNAIPYSPHWALTEDFFRHYQQTAPELYARLRNDPALALVTERQERFRAQSGTPLVIPGASDLVRATLSQNLLPAPVSGGIQNGVRADDEFGDDGGGEPDETTPYPIVGKVALLSIDGPMTKKPTSAMFMYGGTSTLMFRERLRHAANNPRVKRILVDFHSPGGQVFGTYDTAADIAKTDKIKPVEGFVPDLCGSACMWVASQCRKLTIGPTALVGSIGTYMVVTDTSKMAEADGVRVIVIRAGEFKGAGEPGTEITDAQIARWQAEVDALNAQFLKAVSEGRKMSLDAVKKIADGSVFVGAAAIDAGLADVEGDYDSVLNRLVQEAASEAADADTGVDAPAVTSTPAVFQTMALPGWNSAMVARSGGAVQTGGGSTPGVAFPPALIPAVLAPAVVPGASLPTPVAGVPGAEHAPMTRDAVTALAATLLAPPDAPAPAPAQTPVATAPDAQSLPINPTDAPAPDAADAADGTPAPDAASPETAPDTLPENASTEPTGQETETMLINGTPAESPVAAGPANEMPVAAAALPVAVPTAATLPVVDANGTPAAAAPAAAAATPAAGHTVSAADFELLNAVKGVHITSVDTLRATMFQAQDGRESRQMALSELVTQTARAKGAGEVEGKDYQKMFAMWSIGEIQNLTRDMKNIADTRMSTQMNAAGQPVLPQAAAAAPVQNGYGMPSAAAPAPAHPMAGGLPVVGVFPGLLPSAGYSAAISPMPAAAAPGSGFVPIPGVNVALPAQAAPAAGGQAVTAAPDMAALMDADRAMTNQELAFDRANAAGTVTPAGVPMTTVRDVQNIAESMNQMRNGAAAELGFKKI